MAMTASDLVPPPTRRGLRPRGLLLAWAVVALVAVTSFLPGATWLRDWSAEAVLPLGAWLDAGIKGLADLGFGGDVRLSDLTRALSPAVEAISDTVAGLLSGGIVEGFGSRQVVVVPSLSWLGLSLALVVAGLRLGGWRLAGLTAATLAFLLTFGLWEGAAVTMAQMLLAVPLALAVGLGCAVWLFYRPGARPGMLLIVDQAQTIPIFSYLVPIVVFFGLGTAPAILAAIIYAAPATVRAALVGLEEARREVGELAVSTGATRRQALWSFLLPTARIALRTGGTQVVLLAFSTSILASLVGSGGLGYDVLTAMRQLNLGRGIEAGLGITLLAVTMNRFVTAAVPERPSPAPIGRRVALGLGLGGLAVLTLASLAVPALSTWPEGWTVSTGGATDRLVDWFTVTFFAPLDAMKTVLLVYVFLPFERLLLALPWAGVVAAIAAAGVAAGGWRLGLLVGLLTLCFAAVGLWDKTMSTVYLCSLAVAAAALAGFPLGVWSARSRQVAAVLGPVADTLQTLPPFLYLIPAIMLFGNGDFSAFFAIFLFALVPMFRYTEAGLRGVPSQLVEAGRQMGCTRGQLFRLVELPAARRMLLVGLNQTILLGLSMLVVTALIGTHDLGQEALYALQKSQPGRALVAGLGVAALAIIADRLIGGFAERRREGGS